MSLEEVRDIVIVVYGAMGVLLMLAFIVVSVLLWIAIRGLTRAVRDLLDDPVRPTLEEAHRIAQNVRGTTEFVADTAVHPLIRVVSIARGVRRGVSTVAGLRRRSG